MSNALKNVAESTAHVLSDLVDEARDRIEDLPPLGRARRRNKNTRWIVVMVVAALGLLTVVARRLCREATPTQDETSGAGARLAEKSLAVS